MHEGWSEDDIFTLRKPERVFPDKLFLPDIRLITKVDIPSALDLSSRDHVVNLLQAMVVEEKEKNHQLLGAFLCGSIAQEESNNGSDVDVVLVVDTKNDHRIKMKIVERLRILLQTVFEVGYGVSSDVKVIDVSDMASVDSAVVLLNLESIPISLEQEAKIKIDEICHFSSKPKYEGERYMKIHVRPAIDPGPRNFVVPDGQLYPWWVELALLNPIANNINSLPE